MEKIDDYINNLKKELFLMEKYIEKVKNEKKSNKKIKISQQKNKKRKPAGSKIPIMNMTNLNFQNSLRN
jgi:hypothetical protein